MVTRDMQVPDVGSSMWRKPFRLCRARAAFLLIGGLRQILCFRIESLHPGGVRKHTGGRSKRNQIGRISDGRSIRDSFLRHIWIRRSRSLLILSRRSCLLLSIIGGSQILSRYDAETAANPAEMLRRFKQGAKKKWRSMTTILPYETYQEFYEIMLRI